jgi:hypothetical protein
MHLKAGDRVEFVMQDDGTAVLIPATMTLAELRASIPAAPRSLTLPQFDEVIRGRAAGRAKAR